VNGDIGGALVINPLGALIALAFTIVPLWIIIDMLRRSDSLFRWYVSAETGLVKHKWISVPAITVVLLNWFWNIAKGL
jgi:predicted ferric reductase